MTNRRIGSFKNPDNGDMDWFEPATASVITILHRQYEDATISLDNIEETKEIKVILTDKDGKSAYIAIDELLFANKFVEAVYGNKTIDEIEWFNDIVKEVYNKLHNK